MQYDPLYGLIPVFDAQAVEIVHIKNKIVAQKADITFLVVGIKSPLSISNNDRKEAIRDTSI